MFLRPVAPLPVVVILILGIGRAWAADATVEKRYPLPPGGFFQMKVPVNWDDQFRKPSPPIPSTITLQPRDGRPFAVLVTPIWKGRPDIPAPTKDMIRQDIERALDGNRDQAVEKNIAVVEFEGSSGPGFYFSATDKAPKSGEYKFMTQGILKVSDLAVTFTILTNDDQDHVVRDALAMVKSAVYVQP